MTCLSGWPFIYSLSVRKLCQLLKADCTETIKRVVKPSKEPIKTVNEARLLPPSGEASTHSDIIKTRRACKPLYSLFSLKKKGICSTGIKCILMYIIKIIKRVTSNQGSLTSRSNLSCTFINRKKRHYILCQILLGGTGPHSGWLSLLCTLLMWRPRDSIHLKVLPQ